MTRMVFLRWPTLRRLLVKQDGVATIEFALILPVMLLILVGTVDVGNAVTAHRSTITAAQTAAEFVSRERKLSDAEVLNAFTAVSQILNSTDPAAVGATIYSVSMATGTNAVTVDWVETSGLIPPPATASLPAGILVPGKSVIVARVNYTHKTTFGNLALPMVGSFIAGTIEMKQVAYLRPRSGKTVTRSNP